MNGMDTGPEQLLARARRGDAVALGQLLECYRAYVGFLARVQLDRRLQSKFDASDVVQGCFLEAHRDFPRFRGENEREFLSWLRQILASTLADEVRRYQRAQRRDVRLERDLENDLDMSSRALDRGLVASGTSPSGGAARREQGVILADALEKLPGHYQEVLVLRHLDGLSFPEVAQRMGRSLDSVKNLWTRALARLRDFLGARHEAG